MSMRRVQLSASEDRARRALETLTNVLALTDQALADRLIPAVKYQWVQNRRKGAARIRIEDRTRLADAIGVPETLFDADAATILRWLADNGSDLLETASPCITTPLVCAA